jgi:hypothetical protein
MMASQKRERFAAANEELRAFVRRMDNLANGVSTASERDLEILTQRLGNLAAEVGEADRGEALDTSLQGEIAEYVKNFRSLQTALERVRCIVLARKMKVESSKRRLNGVRR